MLRMRTIWSWWEFCVAPTSSGFVVTQKLEEAFFSSSRFLFDYFLLFMLNLELQVKKISLCLFLRFTGPQVTRMFMVGGVIFASVPQTPGFLKLHGSLWKVGVPFVPGELE